MQMQQLIKNYHKENHISVILDGIHRDDLALSSIRSIYSEKWQNDAFFPYEACTHLLDSYYCLPERPDMAFTHLWKSINSIYKMYALSNSPEERLNDSFCVGFISQKISDCLNYKVQHHSGDYSIEWVIGSYMKRFPLKALRFIGNQFLKGYVIEKAGINRRFNSSTYFSFSKEFDEISKGIFITYGEAYRKICNPRVASDNAGVELGIDDVNQKKSAEISYSLAAMLKRLLNEREVELHLSESKEQKIKISLDTNERFITFIFKGVLYSIRNNTVHGTIASRLNSKYVDKDSLKTSSYIFLLGHLFLYLELYLNQNIDINDLAVNIDNLPLLPEEIN